jgi:hypothetical protein
MVGKVTDKYSGINSVVSFLQEARNRKPRNSALARKSARESVFFIA